MTDITYHLENYLDRERVILVVTNGKLRTRLHSRTLGVSLDLRVKGDHKWTHFWLRPGAWLLSKIRKSFDLKRFMEEYSSQIGRVLYFSLNHVFVKNKVKYVDASYVHLEHELRHRWQKKNYVAHSTRYSLVPKFRAKMEIDAILFSYRDKINHDTKDKYREKVLKKLTKGIYFDKVDVGFIESETNKQLERYL